MNQKENIKRQLEERKDLIGLVGARLVLLDDLPGNSFSASISPDWMTIRMSYERDLNLVPDEETERYCRKAGVENPELKIGEDMIEHETGHRENRARTSFGCPHDLETHDRIKDAVVKALRERGRQGLENYVTNVFEDILDNVNCRRYTDFAGQTLFWNNQGLVRSKNKTYNPFYEAFVRINLFLGGDVKSHSFLKRFFNGGRAMASLKAFLNDFKQAVGIERVVKAHDKPEFSVLFDLDLEKRRNLWEKLAYSFALHTADLLEEMPEEKMFCSSNDEDENSDEHNPFDREMKVPQNRQEIAYERYIEGRGMALHREPKQQLYDLYKRISRDIPVETSFYTGAESMPLVYFGRKMLGEDEQIKRVRGIGFEENRIRLKTTRHALHFPVAYKKHPVRFPRLKIVKLDRSGSMALNPDNETDERGIPVNIGDTSFIPWGNKSKYHFALKGYFGIDNFLERQGILNYVACSALGFSGEQAVRGNAREVALSVLESPSGGTFFDVNKLEEELSDDSFVLSISDGELSLSEEQKTKIRDKLTRCDYAHIQIGNSNSFSDYLKSIGIPVIQVRGDEDLARAMVKFTSDYYRQDKLEGRK